MKNGSVAVMQPYLFPYIGYFQLVKASNHFVFYDDVNFIKQGWIHRNRILINQAPTFFQVECKDASPNRKINETMINPAWDSSKLMKTLEMTYKKAPFYSVVIDLVREVLADIKGPISKLNEGSIVVCSRYLELESQFHTSSALSIGIDEGRAQRLVSITKYFGSDQYINLVGGQELYSKELFAEKGVTLSFVNPVLNPYPQFNARSFVPGLSIIDVLMNNSPEATRHLIDCYELV